MFRITTVAGRVVEQHHRPGRDHAPAIVLVHAEVTGLWHALQDGRNRR
jgi:LPS sulfotransferase NodH